MRMDMSSRNQYLKVLQIKYKGCGKKEKSLLLDEYCDNIGQHRKHVIKYTGSTCASARARLYKKYKTLNSFPL
jgi:hypothetical protein